MNSSKDSITLEDMIALSPKVMAGSPMEYAEPRDINKLRDILSDVKTYIDGILATPKPPKGFVGELTAHSALLTEAYRGVGYTPEEAEKSAASIMSLVEMNHKEKAQGNTRFVEYSRQGGLDYSADFGNANGKPSGVVR